MRVSATAAARPLGVVACAALLLLSAAAAAQTPTPAHVPIAVAGPAELEIWNRKIITLRARIGETSPAERVARAAERIEAIPDDELGDPPHAFPARVGAIDGLMVFVGTRQVFNILQEDLDPESNETLAEVGTRTEQSLAEVLAARAHQQSLPLLLRGLAATAVATGLFLLLVWSLVRFERWSEPRLAAAAERRGGAAVRQVREYVALITRRVAQVAALAIGASATYVWLAFALAQFPYTEPWGDVLGDGLRHTLSTVLVGIVTAVPGVITVAIILVLARIVARLLHGVFVGVEAGRLSVPFIQQETAEATRRISTVLVWLFAIIVAYPYIPGSSTEAFRGVSVFVGLMLSLGSAGLVNQVMSGLVVVYARAIRPGEYVKVGDVEGLVTEVGLLSTKVVTVRKEEITIPNAVMIGEATINYSRLSDKDGAVVSTSVTIGYDAPWRQVHALLCLAAERSEAVRRDPPPRVIQRALNDFYVEYTLMVHVDQPARRPTILSELHAHIQDAFNEYGVQIMSPHFQIQPNAPVLVPKDKWREAPAETKE